MYCNAESYTIENYKSDVKPAFAGNFRFLLGLVMLLIGLYVATLSNIQGHGLGFLLVFGAPFMILKDNK